MTLERFFQIIFESFEKIREFVDFVPGAGDSELYKITSFEKDILTMHNEAFQMLDHIPYAMPDYKVLPEFHDIDELLEFLKDHISYNKGILFNWEVHTKWWETLQELENLLQVGEPIIEGLERRMNEKDAIEWAQQEYLENELTFNGIPIRNWFEDRTSMYVSHIETNLGVKSRTISKTIAGVFFSNLRKDFILVLKAYRKNAYALCQTQLIQIFKPDMVDNIRYLNISTNEELTSIIEGIDKSYVPLFLNIDKDED